TETDYGRHCDSDRHERESGDVHLAELFHQAPAFWSSSSSSRCFFVSFFGTVSFTRARTSPRPEPFRRGAPLPFTRSKVPSTVPGLTLTVTGPSGVGTSALAPRAASENGTAMSTTRSEPRRVYSFDGSTRVTTNRSPASAPPKPASPFPRRRIREPSLTPAGIFTL